MFSPVRLARCLALFSFLAGPGHAATIIVDVNNGPGTQFTQIQPAIDAAQPGDVLFVRAGNYRSFTLTVGLSIVAAGSAAPNNVVVDPGVVIRDVPVGQTVALRGLFLGNLEITDCAGLVTADVLNLALGGALLGPGDTCVLDVTDCADVRMRQFGINPGAGSGRDGVRVTRSRFEADGVSIDGARGQPGDDGGIGLICGDSSEIVISFGRVRGGTASFSGGGGGTAITVASTARLAINGTEENEVAGGSGGLSGAGGDGVDIAPGADVRVGHRVRVSGGTSVCCAVGAAFAGAGTPVIANPTDLGLFIRGGVGGLGVPPQIVLIGEPGEAVVMLFGVDTVRFPIPGFGPHPLLVQPLLAVPFGTMPATQEIIRAVRLPTAAPPGLLVVLQAASARLSGDLQLSNSTTVISGP